MVGASAQVFSDIFFYRKNTDDEDNDDYADDIKEDDDDGGASAQAMWNISPSSNTFNAVQYTVRW